MKFEIERLVPRFLLRTKNGYAVAKAIEKAFEIAFDAAEEGLDIIQDPQKMPEWRLDEMARELNCLYDFNGTIQQKRYWIQNATYLYSIYGTPQAIYTFLEGYFNSVNVEEWWEYDGDPYHFCVTISGENYDAGRITWAQKAIAGVKNVRSVLDDVMVDASTEIIVTADTDYLIVQQRYASEDYQTAANDLAECEEEFSGGAAYTDSAVTDESFTG